MDHDKFNRLFCSSCKIYTVHRTLADGDLWCIHHERRKAERRENNYQAVDFETKTSPFYEETRNAIRYEERFG